MEREKETHKTAIPWVRLPAVSGPARPMKEQLQTQDPALDTRVPDSTPPTLVCRRGPDAPTGCLPRVTQGSRICTDRLCNNSCGEEALHARSLGQSRVPSSPAASKSGQRCWEQLSVSLGVQLKPMLPAWGRPSFSQAPRGPQA